MKGFTLIELLVVVLIIGILSSVALPQYQKAVVKSRLAGIIPTVKSAKNSLELYYLANGAYPPDSNADFGFSVTLPQGCTNQGNTEGAWCPNNIMFDLLDHGVPNVLGSVVKDQIGYILWLDHSDYPGAARCLAVSANKVANDVCKSMGGETITGETYRYFNMKVGSASVYALPS